MNTVRSLALGAIFLFGSLSNSEAAILPSVLSVVRDCVRVFRSLVAHPAVVDATPTKRAKISEDAVFQYIRKIPGEPRVSLLTTLLESSDPAFWTTLAHIRATESELIALAEKEGTLFSENVHRLGIRDEELRFKLAMIAEGSPTSTEFGFRDSEPLKYIDNYKLTDSEKMKEVVRAAAKVNLPAVARQLNRLGLDDEPFVRELIDDYHHPRVSELVMHAFELGFEIDAKEYFRLTDAIGSIGPALDLLKVESIDKRFEIAIREGFMTPGTTLKALPSFRLSKEQEFQAALEIVGHHVAEFPENFDWPQTLTAFDLSQRKAIALIYFQLHPERVGRELPMFGLNQSDSRDLTKQKKRWARGSLSEEEREVARAAFHRSPLSVLISLSTATTGEFKSLEELYRKEHYLATSSLQATFPFLPLDRVGEIFSTYFDGTPTISEINQVIWRLWHNAIVSQRVESARSGNIIRIAAELAGIDEKTILDIAELQPKHFFYVLKAILELSDEFLGRMTIDSTSSVPTDLTRPLEGFSIDLRLDESVEDRVLSDRVKIFVDWLQRLVEFKYHTHFSEVSWRQSIQELINPGLLEFSNSFESAFSKFSSGESYASDLNRLLEMRVALANSTLLNALKQIRMLAKQAVGKSVSQQSARQAQVSALWHEAKTSLDMVSKRPITPNVIEKAYDRTRLAVLEMVSQDFNVSHDADTLARLREKWGSIDSITMLLTRLGISIQDNGEYRRYFGRQGPGSQMRNLLKMAIAEDVQGTFEDFKFNGSRQQVAQIAFLNENQRDAWVKGHRLISYIETPKPILFITHSTSNLKQLIEIGSCVKKTCQHYETGTHFEGILGHSLDANTQGILTYAIDLDSMDSQDLKSFQAAYKNLSQIEANFNLASQQWKIEWKDDEGISHSFSSREKLSPSGFSFARIGRTTSTGEPRFIREARPWPTNYPEIVYGEIWKLSEQWAAKMGVKLREKHDSPVLVVGSRNPLGAYSDLMGGMQRGDFVIPSNADVLQFERENYHP